MTLDALEQLFHNSGLSKSERFALCVEILGVYLKTQSFDIHEYQALQIPVNLNLKELLRVFSQIDFGESDAIQSIFMKFGEVFMKQNLMQYYTPSAISSFIQSVIVSRSKTVWEPACGVGDLVSRIRDANLVLQDISESVCELAAYNMKLFNHRTSTITCADSLTCLVEGKYDFVITNPPFGVKTIETRKHVLDAFELSRGKSSYQIGVLFIELGLRALAPDGVLIIVVPSGYLTNQNDKPFRKLILEKYRLVSIHTLPKNTFKNAGTGVDTSILVVQNSRPSKSHKILIRHIETMSDYGEFTKEFQQFAYDNGLPNLIPVNHGVNYDAVNVEKLQDYSFQINMFQSSFLKTMSAIRAGRHSHVNEIVTETVSVEKTKIYKYLDISSVSNGIYSAKRILGENLPNRAKYKAKADDILVSRLQGTPSFCIMGVGCDDYIVSNAFFVCRFSNSEERLSFFKFLHTETFRFLFNSMAKGSIMAGISRQDFAKIPFPVITNLDELREIQRYIDATCAVVVFQTNMN